MDLDLGDLRIRTLQVAGLALMRDGPTSGELGYWVRPEARGRGMAARAVAAVTGWGTRSA